MLSVIEETLSGLRIIKAFNGESFSQSRFKNINEGYKTTMLKAYRKRDLGSPLSEFLGAVVMVTLVWFGGSHVINEGISGEAFMGYIILFSQLLPPVKALSTAYNNVQKGGCIGRTN